MVLTILFASLLAGLPQSLFGEELLSDAEHTIHVERTIVAGQEAERRWTARFDIVAASDEVVLVLYLFANADEEVVGLLSAIKHEIEDVWSGKLAVEDGGSQIPIRLELVFTSVTQAHYTVRVFLEPGTTSVVDWCLYAPGLTFEELCRQIVAHEVGHMLGAFDEYASGAVDPEAPETWRATDSLMGVADSESVYPRHLWLVDEALQELLPGSYVVGTEDSELGLGILRGSRSQGMMDEDTLGGTAASCMPLGLVDLLFVLLPATLVRLWHGRRA
ncbi:MAG TPA: hypothetical protein VMZ31_04415 [Phycisphaerae bacterium]|nr:hypothetical protein [Phycisphaerae bacterium]